MERSMPFEALRFTPIICVACKETFGLATATYEVLKKSAQIFHCPFGHPQHFTAGKSDVEKLQEQMDTLRRERDRLKQNLAYKDDVIADERKAREAAERSASAHKGVVTKFRKRVSKGVCPCCNRTFSDLQRHMAGQHPNFESEEVTV
jgi:hypothetical protein